MENEEKSVTIRVPRLNPWMISTIILVIILAVLYVKGGITGKVIQTTQGQLTAQEAGNKAVDYINKYLLRGRGNATLLSASEENGLFALKLEIGGRTYDSYVTMDGKLLFPSAIDLTQTPETPKTETQETQEIPKSDRPEVHVFVMSHCPFGTQFLKAYVPVIELLGDKADLEINFCDYAMHGKEELDDNNRIYCIQKEQKDKLTEYLRCFLVDGDYEKCIEEVGIDKAKLESCIRSTDEEFKITELYNDKSTWSGGRFPQYPVESDLNSKYGVGGSPSLVINDVRLAPDRRYCSERDEQAGKCIVHPVNRSPEAIKEVICSAFNNPPEECNQKLSTTVEQPGFGPLGTGSGASSAGKC